MPTELIRGPIIYPDQSLKDTIKENELFKTPMGEYVQFYKLGIRLPELKGQ